MDSIFIRVMQGRTLHGVARPVSRLTDLCEDYVPPQRASIQALARTHLCNGVHSKCWECECVDHCAYGKRYMELLRARVKAQKHGWRGYDRAASPLIRAAYLADRKKRAKKAERERQRAKGVRE